MVLEETTGRWSILTPVRLQFNEHSTVVRETTSQKNGPVV